MEKINQLIKNYEDKKTKNEHLFKDLDPIKQKASKSCLRGKILAYNSILRDLKQLRDEKKESK